MPWYQFQTSRRSALLSGLGLAAGVSLTGVPAWARASTVNPHPTADPAPTPVRLTLPAPTGHLAVGTTSLHLVDTSRPDPWVPNVPFRELMIQIWYPARDVHDYPRAPWLSPLTTEAFLQSAPTDKVLLPVTDGHLDAPVHRQPGGWPVVLYSHNLQGHRSESTSLVQDLASHGYVVVTIDHVHDAFAVEFPGGRLEKSFVPDPSTDEVRITSEIVLSRVADVRFVLDQLAVLHRGGNPDHEGKPLPAGMGGALDLRRTGIYGHSDGGATAAHSLHVDRRITAAADLDGTLWTPQSRAGSHRPLLLFGEETLAPLEASTWAEYTAAQHGPKLQLILAGSKHLTFTDFATLVPQIAPVIGEGPDWVILGIGTIDGLRAVSIERAYLGAFFGRYLRGEPSRLLTRPSPHFPEAIITASGTDNMFAM